MVKCKSTIIHKYHQRLFLNLLKSKDINYHTVRLIDHHYNFYNFVIAGFDVWLWVDLCQVTGMSSYQRLHCNNSLLNPTQTEDMTPHHWRILCLPLIKRFHRALRLDLISMSKLTKFSINNWFLNNMQFFAVKLCFKQNPCYRKTSEISQLLQKTWTEYSLINTWKSNYLEESSHHYFRHPQIS